MSEIVETVTGRTMDELRARRDAAVDADIVEMRLDGVSDPDPMGALQGRRKPVIVTCRPTWEGGMFDGPEEQRRGLLLAALSAGAEFVDVELRAGFAQDLLRETGGKRIICSVHEFTPSDTPAAEHFRQLVRSGAEVVKLAVHVNSLTESLPLFDLSSEAPHGRHVLIGMGPRGVHTRILSARLGNRWTYCGDGVAPGQVSTGKMLLEYGLRRIRREADLYGVVGSPIGHSLSPSMHNAGFEHFALNAAYLPLDARDVDDFLTFARRLGLRGASVTAPFKVHILPHVRDLDALAQQVGAVNTLTAATGGWTGTNTDVDGFIAPLRDRMDLHGTRATVLGAGGAARAAAIGLRRAGARVTVSARRRDRGETVATAARVEAGAFPPPPSTWDLLVNTTPCGSRSGDPSPMEGTALAGRLVYDLIYTPADTPLLRQARAAGLQTIGGIEMLVAQAEHQFARWTGMMPPAGLFRQAAERASSSRTGVLS